MSELTKEFLDQVIFRINENPPRIEQCLNELSEEEIWHKPNESLNSIGNLVLHLCGNIRQYAISALSETPDTRTRAEEFKADQNYNRKQLISMLTNTVNEATATAISLNEEQLLKKSEVQCYTLSGAGILIHVAEHFSYHTGQIAFLTKFLKNKDLKFYDDTKL